MFMERMRPRVLKSARSRTSEGTTHESEPSSGLETAQALREGTKGGTRGRARSKERKKNESRYRGGSFGRRLGNAPFLGLMRPPEIRLDQLFLVQGI